MAFIPDLKWQLSIAYDSEIILTDPVKFNDENGVNEFKELVLKGSCWKVLDIWNNEYTLSKIVPEIQHQICDSLLSMRDPRFPFNQSVINDL